MHEGDRVVSFDSAPRNKKLDKRKVVERSFYDTKGTSEPSAQAPTAVGGSKSGQLPLDTAAAP